MELSRVAAGRASVAAIVLLGVMGSMAPGARAQDRGLEERMLRLERLLDSSGIMQLLDTVESLKKEVRVLRGELEVQGHAVNQLKQRQRQLYEDLDERIQGVETTARAPANADPGGESTPPSSPSSTPSAQLPAVTADAAEEQRAYQAAFNQLKAGRYDQAASAFKAFLNDYPGGKYGDNAQYWLGETYYVTRQFEAAMREFQTLLRKYPDSQKRTHAMLKAGYIHDELGQIAQARQILEELVETAPDSTAAGLARKRLERLRDQ